MFKKFTALMLMIAFVSGMVCLTGCDSQKSSGSSSSGSSSSGSSSDSSSDSSSAKIDNSSKEALMKSFINAIKNEDIDALFACCDDSSKKAFKEQAKKEGGEKKFIKELKKDILRILQSEYNNDMDKYIADSIEKYSDQFVKKDGKWYLHTPDDASDDDNKTKIDNSSKDSLTESFINAVQNEDIDALFACCDEDTKKLFKKEIKKEGGEKKFIKKLKKDMLNEMSRYKDDISVFVALTEEKLVEGNCLVEEDGKWYLHLSE